MNFWQWIEVSQTTPGELIFAVCVGTATVLVGLSALVYAWRFNK